MEDAYHNNKRTIDLDILGTAHDEVMQGKYLRGGLLSIINLMHLVNYDGGPLQDQDVAELQFLLTNSSEKMKLLKQEYRIPYNPLMKLIIENYLVRRRVDTSTSSLIQK